MYACGACALSFASLRAFDGHRVGRHAYTITEGLRFDPPVDDGRRCLATHEMRDVGFAQDGRKRWFLVAHRAGLSERLSAAADMAEAA